MLITREMQIKTTMKYQLTPVRLAIIKKATNIKWYRGCGEIASLQHCWWECKLVQPLQRTVKTFLKKKKKKSKTELPYDSAIFLLGHIFRENYNPKTYMQPNVHSSSIHNNQDTEAPKCASREEWIKKTRRMYTVEHYPAIKRMN